MVVSQWKERLEHVRLLARVIISWKIIEEKKKKR